MDDIITAQRIVSNTYNNIESNVFHSSSFIYSTTNEKMNCYQKYLKNRNKCLSVISSGDQILNLVLEGATDIDCFDISIFPRYFLELKKAFILGTDYDQYLEFFFEPNYKNDEKYDDFYYKSRIFLSERDRKFWDSLINYFDWTEINNSTLFSSQTLYLPQIIDNNPYLSPSNFVILKEKLENVYFNYHTLPLELLVNSLNNDYDFINLSSIIYYVNNYKSILSKLRLNENGIALTYLYSINDAIIKSYSECTFEKFEDSSEGVMILQK